MLHLKNTPYSLHFVSACSSRRTLCEGGWSLCLLWHTAPSVANISSVSKTDNRFGIWCWSFRSIGWCWYCSGISANHVTDVPRFCQELCYCYTQTMLTLRVMLDWCRIFVASFAINFKFCAFLLTWLFVWNKCRRAFWLEQPNLALKLMLSRRRDALAKFHTVKNGHPCAGDSKSCSLL